MNAFPECKLIAEVKTKSPYGYKSSKHFDELLEIAIQKGDIISIHTNPLWGGDFKLLEKARKKTNKPILAKGLHLNEWEFFKALDYGANYVLTVGHIPSRHRHQAWYEPLYWDEYIYNLDNFGNEINAVVINQRDLLTGERINRREYFNYFVSKYDKKTSYTRSLTQIFEEWYSDETRPKIYIASNITHIKEVMMRYDGCIVGAGLQTFDLCPNIQENK